MFWREKKWTTGKSRFEINQNSREKKNHNKKCKLAHVYKVGDIVFIERAQFGTNLKIKSKFFAPYKVVEAKWNNHYEVIKVRRKEGPLINSAAADVMKSLD